jgi:aminoglycoside phosphotransferase (APT) family kinase protein
LREQGFPEGTYRFGRRLEELRGAVDTLPWLADVTSWLMEHLPPEPERLCVCHGDFHPLNILVQDGQITGVVDWGGLMIADPVLDVANAIVLGTIPAKHLFPQPGWDKFPEMYLDAYGAHRPLDLRHLDYYKARRCATALLDGARGNRAWQILAVVEDLIEQVHNVTGIWITLPSQEQDHRSG